jgi:hypothetical protein
MTRDALADRLVNYSDALAAFAVVNALAFLLALSETEIRCSLIPVQWLVYAGQCFIGVVITVSLVVLRRLELSLRKLSAPQPSEVEALLRHLFIARFAIVWVAVAIAAGLSILPLADTSCQTGAFQQTVAADAATHCRYRS